MRLHTSQKWQEKKHEMLGQLLYLIKVSSDNMDITSQCFKVIIRIFCTEISSAKNVLDFSWYLRRNNSDMAC